MVILEGARTGQARVQLRTVQQTAVLTAIKLHLRKNSQAAVQSCGAVWLSSEVA